MSNLFFLQMLNTRSHAMCHIRDTLWVRDFAVETKQQKDWIRMLRFRKGYVVVCCCSNLFVLIRGGKYRHLPVFWSVCFMLHENVGRIRTGYSAVARLSQDEALASPKCYPEKYIVSCYNYVLKA